jgi:hypothetical protein
MTIKLNKFEAGIEALKFGDVTTSIGHLEATGLDAHLSMNGLEPTGATGVLAEAKALEIKIHIDPPKAGP